MAKLEGVKSLRVDSGENAKIEYDGAIYEKVADGSTDQIGDIVAGYIPIVADELSFFEVVGINNTVEHKGTGMFYDDDGDYNGMLRYDTFRKVDAAPVGATSGAKAGDTVEMTSNDSALDYHEGEQFVVKEDSEKPNHLYIIDNAGDRRYILKYEHLKFKVVKAAEEAPAEELFAKVNRPNNEPIVGDFIELDPEASDYSWLSEDKKYEIIDIDEDGDFIFNDDSGEEEWTEANDIKAIYVKYTQEQAEQDANIGDKILIVNPVTPFSSYSEGDVLTIEDVGAFGGRNDVFAEELDEGPYLAAREYIVLTDAQMGDSKGEIKSEGYIPQEGDIVVITGNTNGSRNKIGDIGKVGEIDIHDARVFVAGRPTKANWTLFDEMRPATAEEKAKYLGGTEEVASAQSEENSSPYGEISVGDKVKVVVMDGEESEHGWGRVNNGDIGVVTDADFLGSIRVDFPNQKNWCAEESELIKVADNGDLLPGTVVKGNISDEVITLGERDFDRDRSYGTAYLVKDNAPFWVGEEQFEILTKEEVKKHADVSTEEDVEAEELIPADEIPVGATVKVVQQGNGHYGETLRVTKNDGSGLFPYYTEELDGGFADVYDKEHLEIVEVPAQEEEKVEEGAIEVGDLVKVIQSPAALPEGSYFIVKRIDGDGDVRDMKGFCYSPNNGRHVELIAKADEVYA